MLFSVNTKNYRQSTSSIGLQKQKPDQFSFNFVLDSPPKNWSRELKGYLSSSLLKSKLPSPKLGEDVKIFVCGPPGQVSAVSGPKKGKEQGELGGILKELGYTEDQVYKVSTSTLVYCILLHESYFWLSPALIN